MKSWKQLSTALMVSGSISGFVLLSATAQADMLGVYGSVDYWNLQGEYNKAPQDTSLRSADSLSLDDKGQAQVSLAFEHPVPLIPNGKIRYTGIDVDTEEQNLAGDALYNIDLDSTDFILYYEILDNIVSVDVGVAAKQLEGDVTYNRTVGADKVEISETAPMLYASAGGKLPFTGLSAKAEVLATNYDDTQITDASAEIKYNFVENLLIDLGAKAGYRILNIELDDQDGFDTKFDFDGPYIGLEAHF
jgi:outer membrane protein